MKVLVDAQLPPGCVTVLRDMGIEALEDIGLRHAADASVEGWAIANGCVLLTKDRDFVGRAGLQVTWVRLGNQPNRVLYRRLHDEWPQIQAGLNAGAALLELW